MRLFVDTDVLLDVLLQRKPHDTTSAMILDWAEQHPGAVAVSWHSLANIHYLSKNGATDFIRELLDFCVVPATGTQDILQALALNFSDLEDAMQVASALRFGAQTIVTRNTSDYRKSPLKAQTPGELKSQLRIKA
jgi:predicted nucleic acid-binding protein